MKKAISVFVFVFVFVSVPAVALSQSNGDLFWIFYSEVRKMWQGPGIPGVSNYSDIAAGYSVYPDVSQEAFAEGRYRILNWPLSVGARFQWQDGSWRSEAEFLLGPSLQLKWGHGEEIVCDENGRCRNTFWDLTVRHNLLFDLREGDVGTAELFILFIKEFGTLTHFQLQPSAILFYFGEDKLPEYTAEDQVQLTAAVEGSLHWVALPRKYIQPLLRLEYTHVWTPENGDSRGVFTGTTGLKGEVSLARWCTFWWSAYGGARAFTGDYPEKWGWVVGGSAGFLFK